MDAFASFFFAGKGIKKPHRGFFVLSVVVLDDQKLVDLAVELAALWQTQDVYKRQHLYDAREI